MNLNSNHKASFAFLIGLFFINLTGIMLVIAALSFAVKIPITPIHFPLAVILAGMINYYASAKYYFVNDKHILRNSALLILVLFIVAFVPAFYFYDVSIDGQSYHQETIIRLKNGWNPFYDQLPDGVGFNILLNHYGKGAEIPQAMVYAFFNRIEAGKATNFFLLIGSFFLTVSFLFSLNKLSTFKVYLIAALATLNPVVIVQLLSYYIDIQLALILQCLFVLGCYFVLAGGDKFKLILLATVIITGINIKFTAIPYIAIFLAGILGALFYRKDKTALKKVFLTAAISSFVAVFLIGFNPYVTNIIGHQNPFYPLAGKGKIDIMTINSPVGFPQKNRFVSFFTSAFSRTANMFYPQTEQPQLKIPFTFKKQELRFSYEEDTRIGGFGVLFSGILILSILLTVLIIGKLRNPVLILFLAALLTILASVFIIQYAWWARYIPQLWLVPVVILVFSELCETSTIKLVRTVTYAIVGVNIFLLASLSIFKNLIATQKTDYQLRQIKTLKDSVAVDFGMFAPSRLKFEEHGIAFKEQHIDSANFVMKYIHANLKLKKLPADLPEPFLFKLDDKLKGGAK